VDQEQQVHIQCLQGKEVLASIGLNVPGFNSLADQGLLRKPRLLKVGVLHDWVELDGVLYSFEKGNNDAVALERVLNERYLSNLALGQGKDVVVFANAASSTGFDIQFTALLGGVPDNRRRPLNEDTLELLQDPNRCGLLQNGLVVKLTRPTLIFKQKTPDGGERYLEKSAANTVVVRGDAGPEKAIELSQPVNYLRLSAVELTAVFNHPAINKRGKLPTLSASGLRGLSNASSPQIVSKTSALQANTATVSSTIDIGQQDFAVPVGDSEALATNEVTVVIPEKSRPDNAPIVPLTTSVPADRKDIASPVTPTPRQVDSEPTVEHPTARIDTPESLPNRWLRPVLAQAPIRFDWFSCLVYDKIAEHFGNSHQGQLGPMSCWAVALGETEDLEDPAFEGIFLTEKHGLGFLHQGRMVRFYKGVAFLGTHDSALEGIGIDLVAVDVDGEQRIVFIVSDDYLSKFDVPESAITEELLRLRENGAMIMNVAEALNRPVPFEIVWTAPAEQQDPGDPQPLESVPAP
jgi:hypothetical protein